MFSPLWKHRNLREICNASCNALSKARPALKAPVFLQDLLGLIPGSDHREILLLIGWGIWDLLVMRANVAQNPHDLRPVDRLRKGKDALILEIRIQESSDVESSAVSDVDEPF